MNDKVARKLLELITLLALPAISCVLCGTTICMLWKWFVVSHFGLQPLPFVIAMGLGLCAGYLTHGTPRRRLDDDYKWRYFFEAGIYKHLMALAIGWTIHLFL